MSEQTKIAEFAVTATPEPKPSREEIVTNEILVSRQCNTLALARGFAGTSNPSTIWQDMIADAQWAFTYYRELEEKDDDVGGLIELLKLLVLSRPAQITPKDDTGEAVSIAEFVQEQFDRLPDLHNIYDAILDAPGHGVSIAELMWDVSEGQVAITDVKDCPQELFTFGPMYQPQIGPLRFLGANVSSDGGQLVPEQKFLVWTYRPRSRNRRGRPLLRAVFWPSWFKRQTLRFWLRFGEKGPGTAAVKYPTGATDDEKAKALAAAENVITSIAVAVPENFGLITELLTAARSQNPAVYEKLVDRMELAITRRILGQTLTTRGGEGGSGSYALGGVHEDILFLKVKELASGLENVVNDQIVRRLVMWNYGPNAPMPRWTLDKESAKDLSQMITVDDKLQSMGVPMSLKFIQEKYGVPEVAPDEEVLTRVQAPAPQIPDPNAPNNLPTFATVPGEVLRAKTDVQKLLDQLKKDSLGAYGERIKALVSMAYPGGAQ